MIRLLILVSTALLCFCAQAQTPRKITFSVFSSDKYVCEATVYTVAEFGAAFTYDKASVLNCLKELVDAQKFNSLSSDWSDKISLTQSELDSSNVIFEIDPEQYQIKIRLKADDQKPLESSVRPQTEEPDFVSPAHNASISGYLNYSVSGSYSEENLKTEFRPGGSLNPVLGSNGYVLESYHRYQPESENIERLETYLIKDLPKSYARVRIGDNYTPTSSLISSYRFTGVSVNRNYNFSQSFINRPFGEREVFLERPAKVDVLVNGMLISTLNLQAGRHLIQDIPTNQGINNVILRITELGGEIRLIQFQTSVEENLFKRGLSDYSLNVGTLNTSRLERPEYSNQPVGSAIYRYGLTNQWTTGVTVAGTEDQLIYSHDNTIATNRGIFRVEVGASRARSENGEAARLSYTWICPCRPRAWDKRFNFGVEAFTPGYLKQFSPAGRAETSNKWGAFASYSLTVSESLSLRLSHNYSKLYLRNGNTYISAIEINKNLPRNLFVSGRYSNSVTDDAKPVHEVGVQLTFQFNDGASSATAATTLPSEGAAYTRLNAHYQNPLTYETALAEVSNSNDRTLAYVTASKGFEKFDLAGQVEHTIGTQDARAARFTLNPSGSIAFADGHFGFGRYIRDSFILVENRSSRRLFLNGDEFAAESKIASNGTGILTHTQAYRSKTVSFMREFDPEDVAEEGTGELISFKPTYKSGLIYVYTHKRQLFLRGRLVDELNQPVALTSATLHCEGSEDVAFFTDYDGSFFTNREPNACKITVGSRPFDIADVPSSSSEVSVLNIGILQMRKRLNGE